MCKLAFEVFVDRIVGFVGSYYVKLEGRVDALVFAGGIGEKGSLLRERVVERSECLGFRLNHEKNNASADDAIIVQDIGASDARHRALLCKTDEQVRLHGCRSRVVKG